MPLESPHQHAATEQQNKCGQHRQPNLTGEQCFEQSRAAAGLRGHHDLHAAFKNRLGKIHQPFALRCDRDVRERRINAAVLHGIQHFAEPVFANLSDGKVKLLRNGGQKIDAKSRIDAIYKH